MKRFLSMLLATLVLAASLPVCSLAAGLPYKDIPENAWYRNAVTQAYEDGLFKGVSDTEFDPEGTMTRAMFVTVLANMTSDYDETKYQGKPAFDDVNADDWFAAPINWAIEHELTEGVGDNLFDPNGKVTREQMAVFMFKYAKVAGNDTSFTEGAADKFVDSATVSNWAKDAVDWAVTHGVIAGDDNNRLNPINDAQRCEVAQVVINALPVMENTSLDTRPEPTPEIPSGGGGGGGGGTVTPPDPTPTPDYNYADRTKFPELKDVSNIPEGAMSYEEFSGIFNGMERNNWSPSSPKFSIFSARELTQDELDKIELLGEDLQYAYLFNLAITTLSTQTDIIDNNFPRKDLIKWITVTFFTDMDNVDGAREVGWIDFSLPCSYTGYEPDGVEDELITSAHNIRLDYDLYVDTENPDRPHYADPLLIPELNTIKEIPEGALSYNDFCKIFSNYSLTKTSYGELKVDIYCGNQLTDEQLFQIRRLGQDLQLAYCENLLFTYLKDEEAQTILKNEFPRKDVVDSFSGNFYSDYLNSDGEMKWGEISFTSDDDILNPDGEPNSVNRLLTIINFGISEDEEESVAVPPLQPHT